VRKDRDAYPRGKRPCKPNGPGRNRTCDLGIKSATNCAKRKLAAACVLRRCNELKRNAPGGDEPVRTFVRAFLAKLCNRNGHLSARMAVLHARGQMAVGDRMTHASVIGSTFDGRIVSETGVGGRPGITPAIRGRAWTTAIGGGFPWIRRIRSPRAISSRRPGRAPTCRRSRSGSLSISRPRPRADRLDRAPKTRSRRR